jgi:hypothetical protein
VVAVLVVALAAVLASAGPADARWRVLSLTVINDKKLCRDGITFIWGAGQQTEPWPATPPPGTPATINGALQVQATPPFTPGADWPVDTDLEAGTKSFTAPYEPFSIKLSGTNSYYSHRFKNTFSFPDSIPAGSWVRLDTAPGNETGTVSKPIITDSPTCYLYGPIDIKPSDPANEVDPSATGNVGVGLLSTPTFDARKAKSPRFGPNRAAPAGAATISDLNGDGRLDARYLFPIQATGITCSTTLGRLEAKLGTKTFFEQDVVHPIC